MLTVPAGLPKPPPGVKVMVAPLEELPTCVEDADDEGQEDEARDGMGEDEEGGSEGEVDEEAGLSQLQQPSQAGGDDDNGDEEEEAAWLGGSSQAEAQATWQVRPPRTLPCWDRSIILAGLHVVIWIELASSPSCLPTLPICP